MSIRPSPAGRERARTWLVIGGLAVVAAVLLLVFVLRLSHTKGAKTQLGDSVFTVGKATTFASKVDRGGPLLFPDLRSHSRNLNVYVQHIGPGAERGWLAFDAHTSDVACLVVLDRRTLALRDCHGRAYPRDGTGLTRYKTTVDITGRVVVDLSQSQSQTP